MGRPPGSKNKVKTIMEEYKQNPTLDVNLSSIKELVETNPAPLEVQVPFKPSTHAYCIDKDKATGFWHVYKIEFNAGLNKTGIVTKLGAGDDKSLCWERLQIEQSREVFKES